MMNAKLRNSGQTCVCANRIFIHKSILDSFLKALQEKLKTLKIGDPLDEKTDLTNVLHPSSEKKVQKQVEDVLAKIDLGDKRNVIAQELSHGEKQWLEIGMVLTSNPSLLLLDEPTAGMTPAETHKTSELIQRICEEISTIVIEHDLKFVREIATKITVLQRGSLLAEGPIDEIAQNETVRQAYLGKNVL